MTYFLTLIAAFILYYLDRVYSLGYLYQQSKASIPDFSSLLRSQDAESEEAKMDPSSILVASLVILTLVLALKRVLNKRKALAKQASELEAMQDEGMVLRSGR